MRQRTSERERLRRSCGRTRPPRRRLGCAGSDSDGAMATAVVLVLPSRLRCADAEHGGRTSAIPHPVRRRDRREPLEVHRRELIELGRERVGDRVGGDQWSCRRLLPTLARALAIARGDHLGKRRDDPVAQASIVLGSNALEREPKARRDPRR